MEEDQKPFPTMLFVNEAFRHTKAMESSMTGKEIEQKSIYQSSDFRFQNLPQGVKSVECEPGTSWSEHSNEDGVKQIEENDREHKLINDSDQIKCESEITQVDTDSLVSNNVVNNEVKKECINEECFVTDISNQIKCEREDINIESSQEESFVTDNSCKMEIEIDVCDDVEPNDLYPMASEKNPNRATYSKLQLERNEEGGIVFNSPGHTTNRDRDQVIHKDMSTELHSIIQLASLKECRVFIGPRIDQVITDSFGINPIRTLNHGNINSSDRKDELMSIQPGHEIEKFSYHTLSDKTFTHSSQPTTHKGLLIGEKPFQCTVCEKAFAQNVDLATHMRLHTGEKTFKCTVCDKVYTHKSHLTVHMRLHTGEKSFKCTFCDKAFVRNSDLKPHMRFHTGEKPFLCTVCGKAFTRNIHLVTHMRLHTGEKPFTCIVCDKAFPHRSQLNSHMNRHSGEKPFKCTVCDKGLSRKSHLTYHMRLHTGEKPFICTVCGEAFTHKGQLTTHMRLHT